MADRDAAGRFVEGNTASRNGGRPKRAKEEKFIAVTIGAVSLQEWREIVHKARDQARRGDAVARKWLSGYLLGPPVQKQEHDVVSDITVRVIYDDN